MEGNRLPSYTPTPSLRSTPLPKAQILNNLTVFRFYPFDGLLSEVAFAKPEQLLFHSGVLQSGSHM